MIETLCPGTTQRPARWGNYGIACPHCGLHFARQRFVPLHAERDAEVAS